MTEIMQSDEYSERVWNRHKEYKLDDGRLCTFIFRPRAMKGCTSPLVPHTSMTIDRRGTSVLTASLEVGIFLPPCRFKAGVGKEWSLSKTSSAEGRLSAGSIGGGVDLVGLGLPCCTDMLDEENYFKLMHWSRLSVTDLLRKQEASCSVKEYFWLHCSDLCLAFVACKPYAVFILIVIWVAITTRLCAATGKGGNSNSNVMHKIAVPTRGYLLTA